MLEHGQEGEYQSPSSLFFASLKHQINSFAILPNARPAARLKPDNGLRRLVKFFLRFRKKFEEFTPFSMQVCFP